MHPRYVSTVLIQLNVVLLLYGINANICKATNSTVHCSDQNFTGFEVHGAINYLYFKNNFLKNFLIFENITITGGVYLANNHIETLNLPHNWQDLTVINLKSNRIKKVHKNTFSECLKLKKLNLNSNYIDTINDMSFYNIFINDLDLGNNCLTQHSFLKELPYLTRLNLSHNKITEVDTFKSYNLQRLESLNLSNNHINGIKSGFIQNLPGLLTIDMSNNNIKEVGVIFSTQLIQTFNLQFNEIRELKNIDFNSYINKGTTIQLEHNKLTCSFIEALYRSQTTRITFGDVHNGDGVVNGRKCHDNYVDRNIDVVVNTDSKIPYTPDMDNTVWEGYKYIVPFVTACILITVVVSCGIFIYFCLRKDKKRTPPVPIPNGKLCRRHSTQRRRPLPHLTNEYELLPQSCEIQMGAVRPPTRQTLPPGTPHVPTGKVCRRQSTQRGRPLPQPPNEYAQPPTQQTLPPEDEDGYLQANEHVYSIVKIVPTQQRNYNLS